MDTMSRVKAFQTSNSEALAPSLEVRYQLERRLNYNSALLSLHSNRFDLT